MLTDCMISVVVGCRLEESGVLTDGVLSIVGCRLEESGVLTDCSIRTQEADDTLDFNFSSTNVVNKIIMKVPGGLSVHKADIMAKLWKTEK